MGFKVLIVSLLLFLASCCQYASYITGRVDTATGSYRLILTDCSVVQEIFQAYGGDPRLYVEACTVWTRGEIWYCTERGLKAELENVRSYKSLRDAAIRDLRTANPLL